MSVGEPTIERQGGGDQAWGGQPEEKNSGIARAEDMKGGETSTLKEVAEKLQPGMFPV